MHLTVFSISPQLFFFIGFGFFVCLNAALYFTKAAFHIKINLKHEFVKWIFSIYLLIAAAYEFFPVQYAVTGVDPEFSPAMVNLAPFSSVSQAINVFGVRQLSLGAKVGLAADRLLTSLILMIPFGLLLPQLNKAFRSFALTFASAFSLSLAAEIVQYVLTSYSLLQGPTANIDDVIESLIGAIIGFLIWRLLFKFSEKKNRRQPQ